MSLELRDTVGEREIKSSVKGVGNIWSACGTGGVMWDKAVCGSMLIEAIRCAESARLHGIVFLK